MPWPVCRIIPSAFRLQPAADFTLEVNRTALPSLMDPGIDWLYLNFDMVASPNPIIGVYDARGSADGHGYLEVPDGSKEIMEVFTDYFDSREQPWVPTEWNFASDQLAFIEKDVAVGGLFTGSSERKTDRQALLFGGTAGRPRDPNYHSSGDDLGNVDPEALSLMTDAITHAATTLAQDTEPLQ